ncbi:hypothetical protein L1887_63296 [Cichorium endivia]|nr:hypothetical protein L1887_63296 [Cichorium endivia]
MSFDEGVVQSAVSSLGNLFPRLRATSTTTFFLTLASSTSILHENACHGDLKAKIEPARTRLNSPQYAAIRSISTLTLSAMPSVSPRLGARNVIAGQRPGSADYGEGCGEAQRESPI